MNNVLLWLGGLLVAVLAALFAVPHFVDWTRYRGVFEEEASRVLGRDVRVAGAVNLRLLPTPYVRFEKVRLADAAGQTGEPFFRADDFTLWLAPGPLLRGAIEAREVELRKPILKLRLNASGGGNWQTLSIVRGTLPFVPSDVALQSVQITDGTVSVDAADGQERLRISGIKGELSAAAVEGPFKFAGAFEHGGVRRDVKAATTVFDSDGGLRIRAQVANAGNGDTHSIEGRFSDLSGKPRFDGQSVSQLSFVPAAFGKAEADTTVAAGARRVPLDMRATISADTSSAEVKDISLSFDQDGKPQLIAGSARIGWQDGLSVDATYAARWLDFDQLLADKAGLRPMEAVRRLLPAIGRLAPEGGRSRAKVTIDQLTLSGEAVSDVRLDIARDGGGLRIVDLQGALPGGTRAFFTGTAAPDLVEGDIAVRGSNLSRFLTWLGYPPSSDAKTEGVFSLRSKLSYGPQGGSLRDAVASLGASMLSGGVAYRSADRPRLDLMLDGDEIDLGLISPKALDLLGLSRLLMSAAAADAGQVNGAAPLPRRALALDVHGQDISLKVRATRLMDADRDLRDVDVDAAIINGSLNVKRMRFLSGTGLELEAEGDVADLTGKPHGTLRGIVGLGDEAALGDLLELFDQPVDGDLFKRLRLVAPARVAWTAKIARDRPGQPSPVEITADGQALGRRLTADIRLDASDWRGNPFNVTAAIERPDWGRLRALIENDVTGAKTVAPAASARSRLQIKSSGKPAESLSTYVKLEDDAFDASLAGRVSLGPDAIGGVDGELQLRMSDLLQAWTALGLPPRALPPVAIEGGAEIAFKDGSLKVTPSALELAGVPVGGEIAMDRDKDGNRRVDGKLTVARLSLPRLVDLLVEGRGAPAPSGMEGDAAIWTSAAFDFSSFDRLSARLRIETPEMELTPEVGLARGVMDVEVTPGKINIATLEGDLLGGRLASKWSIEKAPAGASLTGSGSAAALKLDQLARGASGISGAAALKFNVAGRGLSPRGLLSALNGAGQIELKGGQVASLGPRIVRQVADDVITGKREATPEAISLALRSMLSTPAADTRLALGDRQLLFEVGNAAVKVEPFKVDTPDGRAANRSTVDLVRLMIDSEWRIDVAVDRLTPMPAVETAPKPAAPLPPVAVVFVGPVGALGQLESKITSDALARELTVRRMERDVAELERLRRLDEQRAKAEAERRRVELERRKAEEAAREAAAAAAASAGAIPPVEQTPPSAAPPATEMPSAAQPQVMQPLSEQRQTGAIAPPPVTAAGEPAAAAEIVTPLEPVPASGDARRRTTPSPAQSSAAQQAKKPRLQDVFRRQEMGGN